MEFDAAVEAEVIPFIDDMAAAYAWADLAVCRAGAMTIAELEAAGLGALLVPLPTACELGTRLLVRTSRGVTLTDAWLDHVRLASVRFDSGGSGSFVSKDGLVLTNHHVASDCIAKLATQGKDYLATGYLAGKDGPWRGHR